MMIFLIICFKMSVMSPTVLCAILQCFKLIIQKIITYFPLIKNLPVLFHICSPIFHSPKKRNHIKGSLWGTALLGKLESRLSQIWQLLIYTLSEITLWRQHELSFYWRRADCRDAAWRSETGLWLCLCVWSRLRQSESSTTPRIDQLVSLLSSCVLMIHCLPLKKVTDEESHIIHCSLKPIEKVKCCIAF